MKYWQAKGKPEYTLLLLQISATLKSAKENTMIKWSMAQACSESFALRFVTGSGISGIRRFCGLSFVGLSSQFG
jgi:hypothetical protein